MCAIVDDFSQDRVLELRGVKAQLRVKREKVFTSKNTTEIRTLLEDIRILETREMVLSVS